MRSTQTKYWISTCLGLLAAPALAAPNDIEIIANAADAIDTHIGLEGSEAEKQFISLFTRMVLDRTLAIGDEQGITEVAGLKSKEFKAHTLKWVKPMVSKAALTRDEGKRRDAWYELLRIASTDSNAHALLASWMDFEAPASYLAKAKRGTPPRISSQVSASSSDGRLKVYEPNITLSGEIGGAGQGNGVLDAGEWVNLGLAIYNDSARPFFSSSAWVVSGHNCAWVPKAYEIEVQELPARVDEVSVSGKKKVPPTEPLTSWVYLSDSCADKSVVPLQVKVLDTHRAPKTPIILSVNLNVRNRGQATVTDFLVDTDQPGWSDNTPMPEVDVEREFEMSHVLQTSSSGLLSARAAWAIRKDLAKIFKETKPAGEELLPTGSGRFIAGDDLDLKTHELEEYDLAVQAVADELEWESLEDARVWFATDSEVLFETPDPPIEAPPPPPPEVCDNYLDDDGDGKHDCQDSDCKEEKVCNLPSPVGFQDLYNIVAANASIVASPGKVSIPGAVEAVEPGYELVLDKDQLAQQYQCLINQIPLKDCGKVICPDCVEEKVEKKEKVVVDTGRDPAVAYVYRNYFTIPLHWNPHEAPAFNNCDDGRDNDLDLSDDCADSDCPCSERECDDNVDNDSDGLTDCDDVEDCGNQSVCIPVEYSEDICDDGIDNDDDGLIDCADRKDCNPNGLKSERREQCNDGFDNDCDGKIDDEDPGCQVEKRFGRLDFNIGVSTIATNGLTLQNGTDFLTWNVAGGPIPAFGLRYLFGASESSLIRYTLAAERTPVYDIVHEGSASYRSWTLSGGLASHVDFMDGRLYIEPHLLLSLVDRNIAPEANGVDQFSAHDRTPALDIDLEVHFQLTETIGLYAGGGYQVINPVSVNGVNVLDTAGLGGQFGLTYLLGQK